MFIIFMSDCIYVVHRATRQRNTIMINYLRFDSLLINKMLELMKLSGRHVCVTYELTRLDSRSSQKGWSYYPVLETRNNCLARPPPFLTQNSGTPSLSRADTDV